MDNAKSPVDRLLKPQDICSPGVLANAHAYLQTPRKERPFTDWYLLCTSTHVASVFFRASRSSNTHRLTVCDLVAKVYEEVIEYGDTAVVPTSQVLKVRERAWSLADILPGSQHLPPPADTQQFRAGLESLTQWKRAVTTPANWSGSPTVRALTLLLGRRFADAFIEVPVEYIHYLVTLGWPSRSLSATRRLLTSARTTTLKNESAEAIKKEKGAQSAAFQALRTASSHSRFCRRQESEQQALERLDNEVSRLERGLRRFASDAARLQAIQDIAASFDDRSLAEEFIGILTSASRNFKV